MIGEGIRAFVTDLVKYLLTDVLKLSKLRDNKNVLILC